MKILTLSYEFPPIGGGGAGVVRGLAAELVRQGHSVDVVTMGFRGLPSEETVDGIRVRRVDCQRGSGKCTALTYRYVRRVRPVVRAMVRENRYDFVHVHFIFPDGIVLGAKSRRRASVHHRGTAPTAGLQSNASFDSCIRC
jgi:glycosyltransferase involved in cell wall biosynthesis